MNFKKFSLTASLIVTALIGTTLSSTAGAASIYKYFDSVTPSSTITVTSATPYTFELDLAKHGFNPLTETLTTTFLSIDLIDNVSKGNEDFQFDVGTGQFMQSFPNSNVNNGNSPTSFPLPLTTALADLAEDGKIWITLKATSGDYIFVDAMLGVNTAPKATHVPEPASIALMGLGLAAIGLRRRKA